MSDAACRVCGQPTGVRHREGCVYTEGQAIVTALEHLGRALYALPHSPEGAQYADVYWTVLRHINRAMALLAERELELAESPHA